MARTATMKKPETAPLSDWLPHDGTDWTGPYTTRVIVRMRSGLEWDRPVCAGFFRTGPRNLWKRRAGPMGTYAEQAANDCIEFYRIVGPLNLPARLDRIAAERRAA